MFLRGEDFERLALDVPDLVDIEDHLRFEIAHLRLMRFEQEYRRRGILVFGVGLVPHGLGDDARLLCEMRRIGMIEIVGILKRMRQHEAGIEFSIDVDHPIEVLLVELQWIIAAIKELDFRAQRFCRAFRFIPAASLDGGKRRAGLFPGELAFAALAIGQTDNLHPIAAPGVQRDRTAGAPDEVAGMG